MPACCVYFFIYIYIFFWYFLNSIPSIYVDFSLVCSELTAESVLFLKDADSFRSKVYQRNSRSRRCASERDSVGKGPLEDQLAKTPSLGLYRGRDTSCDDL